MPWSATVAKVVDTMILVRNDSCPLEADLTIWCVDMSPTTFQGLASLGTGEIDISWHFMDRSWRP